MREKNEEKKNEMKQACVTETPRRHKNEASMGCVRETTRIKMKAARVV